MSQIPKFRTKKICIEDLEFEVSEPRTFISRVRKSGNSFYALIPAGEVRGHGVKDGEYAIIIISKIIDVKLPELEERLMKKVKEVNF